MNPDNISPSIYAIIRIEVNIAVKAAFKDFIMQYEITKKKDSQNNDEIYLSALQAANYLKVSIRTIYSLF
jgi:hypothetical protein